MRCEVAERAVSQTMDEGASLPAPVAEHAESCPRCTAFIAGAWRLRELSRFEVARPIPDLVPAIMAAVRSDAAPRLAERGIRRFPVRFLAGRRAVAAALVAGLVIGLVVTTGGVLPRREDDTAALASEIPARLLAAARHLEGYVATFDITERNWTRDVPRRTFVAHLGFRAPEEFRVDVSDTTDYPSRAWPRNDLSLATDGRTWRIRGPDPCPAAALPDCPASGPVERSFRNRPPFDPRTAMPTDVIVPMTVLAAADRVSVIGDGSVGDRPAVAVALAYQDATPLFQYLRFLGSWRTFFPQDRVVLWLDRETWFPLRYEVFPAAGAERRLWTAQAGYPPEPPSAPVFTAVVATLSAAPPPPGALFGSAEPAGDGDAGFRDADPASSSPPIPALLRPGDTAGLVPWRTGAFPSNDTRPYREEIAAYASGLGWLTVTRVLGWTQPAPFGAGPLAEPVTLPGGREAGAYEPATAEQPRRVALHTAQGEYLVASNLPRATLLRVAASLPVTGIPQPASWLTRSGSARTVKSGLAPADAISEAGFEVLVPGFVPPGYPASPATATLVQSGTTVGVTLVYRRPAAELDGVGLLIHQATGQDLAPPGGVGQQVVAVGAGVARWSPESHLLEWKQGDVYRSVSGPAFDLTTLLSVARSLEPTEAGS